MATLELISDYKHQHALRAAFNQLTQEVFGFDCEEFYQRGFWDDRYVCHSFVADGHIVSNVSTTTFELVINGTQYHAIQFGTVMTHHAFRGQGLGVELMRHVIERYRPTCDFFYLFAHQQVLGYYAKQQFIPVEERSYSIDIDAARKARQPLRRLDLSNDADIDIIRRLTHIRLPVSKTVGVVHATSIFLFCALNTYADRLFYADDLDCLLVFTGNENGVIDLYDVLCESELRFADILSLMCAEVNMVKKIIFHYTPTYSDITVKPDKSESHDRMFFQGDRTILPVTFLYPAIAHT